MPLVQGAIDGVKMQAVSELREAGEGENRSHYGGDSIEDAALYAGRLASRGAEAFVRARMEELAVKRKEAEAPPLYDLPFDLTASQEPPVSPVSAASMDSMLPELPPDAQEGAVIPASTQNLTQPSAPLELPAPELSAEPAVKPKRRRTHSEPECLPAEKKEDSWTPAYRDAPAELHTGTASNEIADKT